MLDDYIIELTGKDHLAVINKPTRLRFLNTTFGINSLDKQMKC